MSQARHIAVIAAVAFGLGGCSVAGGLAVSAVGSLITGGGGSAPQAASPAVDLREALAGIDDRVSPSCSAALRRLEQERAERASAGDAASLPSCGVRPTCLPGTERPIMMMVCEQRPEPTQSDGLRQAEQAPSQRPGEPG